MRRFILALFCLGSSSFLLCLDVPAGVFINLGESQSLSKKLLEMDWVSGFVVRARWSEIQPTPATFRWERLDKIIAQIQPTGKRLILSVETGSESPAWIFRQGVSSIALRRGKRILRYPIPWDEKYLLAIEELAKALGVRYRAEPAVAAIEIPASGIPKNPDSRWRGLGLTDEKRLRVFERTLRIFIGYFPSASLRIPFEDVENGLWREAVPLADRISKKVIWHIPGVSHRWGAKSGEEELIQFLEKGRRRQISVAVSHIRGLQEKRLARLREILLLARRMRAVMLEAPAGYFNAPGLSSEMEDFWRDVREEK